MPKKATFKNELKLKNYLDQAAKLKKANDVQQRNQKNSANSSCPQTGKDVRKGGIGN